MTDILLRSDRDGVATLTLNRPEKYNALSDALLDALLARIEDLKNDGSVKVVVLAGAGKAFCAGHDLAEINANCSREAVGELFAKCSRMMLGLTRLPQPVIARVHGIATAAGCQLVAMCDLAVAADQARFATSGINVGLFCSTPMVALTRNISRKQAMEMLLTGDFIDAPTALDRGLVNRVAPVDQLDAAVADLVARITSKSPAAIAFGKDLFYRQLESGLDEAYRMAAETMTCNMMAEDAKEGVDAFVSKRHMPQWKGR